MSDNKDDNYNKTFTNIDDDTDDRISGFRTPGDTVWNSIGNLFTRKKPVRFFDIFVGFGFSIFALILLLLVSLMIFE